MYQLIFTHIVAIAALIYGSYTDFKTREVPDFLNYTLIALGIAAGLTASVLNWTIWPVIASIAGLGVGYLAGAAMYYTGQWGGGDAKMLMGLGALMGVPILPYIQGNIIFPLFATTIITILLAGSFYGLFFATYLVFKHWKTFKRAFTTKIREKKIVRARTISLSIVGLCIILIFVFQLLLAKLLFALISIIVFFGVYLFIVAKLIEQVCMTKTVPVSRITEGEWIVDEVKVKGKLICGPKDLGISKKQIELLKKNKIKNIKIKEGIPFIPGFLLGYLIIIIAGNWISILF